jgi:hypothetical protein
VPVLPDFSVADVEQSSMSEPDVTLTDYGLALECAVCAAFLGLTPTVCKGLRSAGMFFFIFLGLSAVTGGTVHGFFPEKQSPEGQFLWQLTLQAIGLAAFSTWILGAGLFATGRAGRWLALAAVPQIALYSTMVLLITQEFWIAFTIYLPAALLLLAGFCRGAWRDGHRFLLVGASGSVLSFVSSFIQFMKIGIDPVYFNHNALAHVVQGVALALICVGIRHAVGSAFLESRGARATDFSARSGVP